VLEEPLMVQYLVLEEHLLLEVLQEPLMVQ
jgi:hypothetical protein